MVAGGRKGRGQALEDAGAAVLDGREFAVHLAGGADDFSPEVLAHGLMAEADAQDGFFSGEGLYDVDTYTGIGGGARAGRNEHTVGVQPLGLGGSELVIAEHAHAHAQLAEVLDEVEGERIVVVDD